MKRQKIEKQENCVPPFLIKRRFTRQIHLGSVAVGGNAPISVQTMTKTDTRDITATVDQILELEEMGCDIVRLAVVDEQAAVVLEKIRKSVHVPLVADIHFDYRLALRALKAGVAGLRINPGNIGSTGKVKEIVRAARPQKIPIRIGVNAGSLEKDVLARHGGATVAALVESALRHVRILEDLDYREIKISVKASDVARTVQAYRRIAELMDYPLHLGVTESGTLLPGAIRSSAAMAILLSEGIGDTLRVSLTDHPCREIQAGHEILHCLGLRKRGPHVIACPTCGRTQIDVLHIAQRIEAELRKLLKEFPAAEFPCVAVMGCMVNGPGEAREADIALAGGKGKAALYLHGIYVSTVNEKQSVSAVVKQVRRILQTSAKN